MSRLGYGFKYCMRLGLDFKTFVKWKYDFTKYVNIILPQRFYVLKFFWQKYYFWDNCRPLWLSTYIKRKWLERLFTGELEPLTARRWMMRCLFITRYVRGEFLWRSSPLGKEIVKLRNITDSRKITWDVTHDWIFYRWADFTKFTTQLLQFINPRLDIC